ncbi:MAG: hypothetical protein SPJ62_16365, partial [Inconstantimicrobium porci]|uniref:hypothetical protein n=1 Tax=Inconstantimicrobium porci TaxID=2652291 RepID=UPI002A91B3FC
MKLPFPNFLLNTPVEIYKTEQGEDGPEEEKVFEGKCIYTDKSKQVVTAEKQLITLSGKVVVNENIDIKEGYVIIKDTKKIIY